MHSVNNYHMNFHCCCCFSTKGNDYYNKNRDKN